MPLSRSRTRKLLGGEDTKSTTSNPSFISEEGTVAVPLAKSGRPTNKLKIKAGRRRTSIRTDPSKLFIEDATPNDDPTPEQLAEFALSDYNMKHGTDFEFVRLHGENILFFAPGYTLQFMEGFCKWSHFNFEAKRRNADPGDDTLLLFAEVYGDEDPHLTKLSLVNPSNQTHGCQSCCYLSGIRIRHPPYGFRAFYDSSAPPSDCEKLSRKDVAKYSKYALEEYNLKNEADVEFARALDGSSFICDGLLMDFTVQNTRWIHMNFKAWVGHKNFKYQLCLFAELYYENSGKWIVATLSIAEPSDDVQHGIWKEVFIKGHGCPCCPNSISHPWRGFHCGFNCPPAGDL